MQCYMTWLPLCSLLVEHAAKFYLKTELLKAFFTPFQEKLCGKTSHDI